MTRPEQDGGPFTDDEVGGANIDYHFAHVRTAIKTKFADSRERSIALTRIEEAELWLGQAAKRSDSPSD